MFHELTWETGIKKDRQLNPTHCPLQSVDLPQVSSSLQTPPEPDQPTLLHYDSQRSQQEQMSVNSVQSAVGLGLIRGSQSVTPSIALEHEH